MKTNKLDLSSMARSWHSPYVARHEIERFSGGILSAKYMANLDSQGNGIPGRIKIGRKVAYPVSSVIEWMEERGEVI